MSLVTNPKVQLCQPTPKTLHRRCTYLVGGFAQAILACAVPFEYASVADHVTISRKRCPNLVIIFLKIDFYDHRRHSHGTIVHPCPKTLLPTMYVASRCC